MPLKTRCKGLGRCVYNVALPNQWARGCWGPEAAADQAAAPQPRQELVGCVLPAPGPGEAEGGGSSASVCLRGWGGGAGGEFCAVPSAPSAHAVVSARPPSSGCERFL